MVNLKIELPDSFFDEELRSGFLVTRQRKEIWAVELDLLNAFMEVCSRHNLQFFVSSGTALGAIRHGGFIPWDDDIDVVMLRPEYNKLCAIAETEFKHPYFFQTEHTDPGSMRGHAQLRNSLTTAILESERIKKYRFNQGIFIDIFPLDSVPDNQRDRTRFEHWNRFFWNLSLKYAKISSRYSESKNGRWRIKKVLHFLFGRNGPNAFYNVYEKHLQWYAGRYTNNVAYLCLGRFGDKNMLEEAWYHKAVSMPFESLSVPVPEDYDAALTRIYGDWRTPRQTATIHGECFFDTRKPYFEYLT